MKIELIDYNPQLASSMGEFRQKSFAEKQNEFANELDKINIESGLSSHRNYRDRQVVAPDLVEERKSENLEESKEINVINEDHSVQRRNYSQPFKSCTESRSSLPRVSPINPRMSGGRDSR